MNKISKIIGAVCVYALSSIGLANADSSAFTGAYAGISLGINGVALDGNYKDDTASDTTNSKGSIGVVEPSVGFEIGYSYPMSDMSFITAGITYNPVDASVDASNATKSKKVTVDIEDMVGVFIEPSFNVTENSAVFVKAAYSEASFNASGNDLSSKSVSDLEGTTVAIGTKIMTDSNLYIKTEVGYTEYDGIKIKNISDDAGTNTATADADVDSAYGSILLGFKF
jgi:outer membrane protein W